MKRLFTFLISMLCFFSAIGQERMGIANSNYSSVNSIFLNPSSSVDSRTLMQFNLAGANIFAMNNQVYVPQFNLWDAAKGDVQDPEIKAKGIQRFVYTKAEVNAPAIVVSNQEIGAGLFIRARVELAVNNIPGDLTQLLVKQKIDTTTAFNVDLRNTRVTEMAWMEYGANFGMMYFKHNKTLITVGGNVKYISGINLGYGNLYKLNAQVNNNQFDVNDVSAKIRYNQPGRATGKGVGFDLGFTYKKMLNFVDGYYSNSKKSGCKYIDYKYKIGFSLLDVGAVKFTQNTYKGDIYGSAVISDFKHQNVDSILHSGFTFTEQRNVPIWATLPTAFSIQADYNLSHHFYVNASLVQGITTARMIGVQHANSLSITPRFETRNIELAIPVTLYRYIYPQVGAAIRFRTFVLGMDNILPLITHVNTYGANIYFNLGFSIFKNPGCKKSRSRYTPTKKTYEGYTFLSFKNKKRTIMANGQGETAEGFGIGKRSKGKGSKPKKEKHRGIIRRNSKKL
jgi:hypothetical protein